jgi:thioredoxin
MIRKMKNRIEIFLGMLLVGFFLVSNLSAQNLSPADFQKKMVELPNAPVIDVRTPGEFTQSHLKNAINININDSNFPSLINKFDKSRPVFVYCLSGSRSAYAANYMHSLGFKNIFELSGGIIKWRGAGLPETSGNTVSVAEMSISQFNNLLNTDKLVLVDFYADWCAPCLKMAPFLEDIKKEMSGKVVVVRINADQNKSVVKELNVSALPTLMVYKNKKVIWSNTGFQTKEEIVSHFPQ